MNLRQNGMSVVEVVVAMGIAAVLMLSIVSLIQMSGAASRNLEVQASWNNTAQLIQAEISNPQSCSSSFGGVTVSTTPSPLPSITLDTTTLTVTSQVGTTSAGQTATQVNSGFNVTDISLQSQGPVTTIAGSTAGIFPALPAGSYNLVLATLTVTAQKRQTSIKNVGGSGLNPLSLSFNVITDAGGTIWECYNPSNWVPMPTPSPSP